jgi:integrase
MAYIEERRGKGKRVTWRVQVRLKGKGVQTATFGRKTDAVQWAQRVEADIRSGRHFPGNEARRRTLDELIERYRQEVFPQYTAWEQAQRASKLGWWSARLGGRVLADITPALISEARVSLAREGGPKGRPAAAGTQARYLAALRHVFGVAVREWEWMSENPVQRVKPPKEPRGRVRYLSDEERERLLRACEASDERRLYPLVVLAISTGARQGELLGLRWQHIDLERGVAIIEESKNGDRRSLSLVGLPLQLLGGMAEGRRRDSDFVFSGRTGAALFPKKAWLAVLKRAGIADFRFHDLRHTAASYLAMSGATLAEIATILGHRTLQMVKRYAHLSEQHTSSVVERMTAKYLPPRMGEEMSKGIGEEVSPSA